MDSIEENNTYLINEKEELYKSTEDTYKASNGIKIKRSFNENGKDINESFSDYLKKCLEG